MTTASPPPAALALTGVAKRFGDTAALVDGSISVRGGSVHALLGENGAGKTTLMRIAFGMLRPDAGRIEIDGSHVDLASPAAAMALGIGMVHQHFTSVAAMTVAENIALGGRGRYDAAGAAARVSAVARETGLALDPAARADRLAVSERQRLEIVKALARRARILILDEPTAVLAPAESEELLRWLRRFAHSGGAVVLITHKLREALATADEVTVLREGRTVLRTAASAASERSLARAMVGDHATVGDRGPPVAESTHIPAAERGASDVSASRETAAPAREVVLRATTVSLVEAAAVPRLRNVTAEVAAGEILGIAGVEGAGQRELMRIFAGRLHPTSGTVERPSEVGFIPEDRHREALVLDFPLYENLALRGAGRRGGLLRRGELLRRAAALLGEFDIRGGDAHALARTLSGGNQQKFVLARELEALPRALVAENPTRGLDPIAADTIRERLRRARAAGCAIVVYASDLDELLLLADRMLVMHAGEARAVPLDREAIGRFMLGLS